MKKLIFLFLLYFISYNVTAQESNNGAPIGLYVGNYDTIWCNYRLDTLIFLSLRLIDFNTSNPNYNYYYSLYILKNKEYKLETDILTTSPLKFNPNNKTNLNTEDFQSTINFCNTFIPEKKTEEISFKKKLIKVEKVSEPFLKNEKNFYFSVKIYHKNKLIHQDTIVQYSTKKSLIITPKFHLFKKDNQSILFIDYNQKKFFDKVIHYSKKTFILKLDN